MTVKSETTLIGALAKALPEIGTVAKNKDNPAFKAGGKATKYADLAAVIDALEPLKAHGLWYRQQAHENSEGAMIETFYIHESGEQLSAGMQFMPASKRDAQGFGSALTYCRRYGLQTAFGLATEDDDGNAASKHHEQPKRQSQPDDPPPGLNDDQVTWIIDQLESHNIPVKQLLGDVPSLHDIPASAYENVQRWINKQIKAKAA
jgi:hypothetical protein